MEMQTVLIFWACIGCFIVQAITHPAGITNCGVSNWISSPPQRAVTLNQGATEMLLALNLSRKCYIMRFY
jgi:hypothetical protein